MFVIIITFAGTIPTYAAEMYTSGTNYNSVMPRTESTSTTYERFTITSGVANVYASYRGDSSVTGASIEMKIQKKVLFWWSTVDGGEWTNILTGSSNSVSHSLSLEKTGSYRAVIEYTVHGSGEDVITKTLLADYE